MKANRNRKQQQQTEEAKSYGISINQNREQKQVKEENSHANGLIIKLEINNKDLIIEQITITNKGIKNQNLIIEL